ncbi:hypothetical protein MLD38_031751 [Melastoma candidum]|uniref:Uncharacterized protein n=1 Tax=Melastoma candidum TaxID=119954 RepID=A0ACB9MQP2_9MYRT|nr:hypothetical protein MLD38_031751 [Melastoma candidum]
MRGNGSKPVPSPLFYLPKSFLRLPSSSRLTVRVAPSGRPDPDPSSGGRRLWPPHPSSAPNPSTPPPPEKRRDRLSCLPPPCLLPPPTMMTEMMRPLSLEPDNSEDSKCIQRSSLWCVLLMEMLSFLDYLALSWLLSLQPWHPGRLAICFRCISSYEEAENTWLKAASQILGSWHHNRVFSNFCGDNFTFVGIACYSSIKSSVSGISKQIIIRSQIHCPFAYAQGNIVGAV